MSRDWRVSFLSWFEGTRLADGLFGSSVLQATRARIVDAQCAHSWELYGLGSLAQALR